MNLFENLLEQHNDLETLLGKPVDELAGALLMAIKNRDRDEQDSQYGRRVDQDRRVNEDTKTEFKPINEISYQGLDWAIEQKKIDTDNTPNDLLYALMKATQFLINHGFLAQIPISIQGSSSTYHTPIYFLTREADAIETIRDWEIGRKKVTG